MLKIEKEKKEQILGNLMISYSIFKEGKIRKFFENNYDIKQQF